MATKVFPKNAQTLLYVQPPGLSVELPRPDAERGAALAGRTAAALPSWRVNLPPTLIRSTFGPSENAPQFDDGFMPLVAVNIGVCPELRNACGGYDFYLNDVFARVQLVVIAIEQVAHAPTVFPLQLQLRVAYDCGVPGAVRFDGAWVPTSFDDAGLVAQTGGLFGKQLEVWGKLPTVLGPGKGPVKVVFGVTFDRVGDEDQLILGEDTIAGEWTP